MKDRIKSLSGKDSVENVKKDIDDIETINIELEHSVEKLLSENENLGKEQEHLKSIYKYQFDSIRKTRVQSNEHCASLIAQINEKSVKNSDLNAQLQEKLDIEPISHRLKNNRDAHEVYLEKTIENTDTLRRLVECARKQNPGELLLESACMFTKHVQELLVYVSNTCPSLTKPIEKLVVVTPMNMDKKVRSRNDNGASLGRGDHPPSPNPISKPRPKSAPIPNRDLIGALYWGEMLPQTRSDLRWRSYRGDFTSALLHQIHN
ncbi:hypothetical protein Tco_1574241, partial [Tanacetum coccineum]